ncbi:hypothetical protein SL1157_1759 [Ruegeria lacuscaerulensis ITI-1157]|nr:hypothetical protein SL1157_1759 [Ruegeria lacuscaerulensis ITI-1157]
MSRRFRHNALTRHPALNRLPRDFPGFGGISPRSPIPDNLTRTRR